MKKRDWKERALAAENDLEATEHDLRALIDATPPAAGIVHLQFNGGQTWAFHIVAGRSIDFHLPCDRPASLDVTIKDPWVPPRTLTVPWPKP